MFLCAHRSCLEGRPRSQQGAGTDGDDGTAGGTPAAERKRPAAKQVWLEDARPWIHTVMATMMQLVSLRALITLDPADALGLPATAV